MRRSHLIAPALALTPLAAVLLPRHLRVAARAGLLVYAGALVVTACGAARGPAPRRDAMLLLVVLPAMHLGWGAGTLAGMFRFGPPLAALARVLGGRGSLGPEAGDEVYAPSLHAGDA
jgi:hypothetical protein